MSEKAPSRFTQYEQSAEAALAENQRQAAIEAKLSSPEVAALNDKAELEIWGSGDRTYTDPESGKVIASPDKPIIGLLDQFAKTRPGPEAKALAEKYETGIHTLIEDEGLELCQAKMVMDMRMDDEQNRIPSLTTEFMKNGSLSAQEAEDKAWGIYFDKDVQRVDTIKNNGIVTPEEYARVRFGKADEAAQTATPEGDGEENNSSENTEEKEQAEELIGKLDIARDAYARAMADKSVTLGIVGGEEQDQKIEQAREEWLSVAKEIAAFGAKFAVDAKPDLSNKEKKKLVNDEITQTVIREHYLLAENKLKYAADIKEAGPKSKLLRWLTYKPNRGKLNQALGFGGRLTVVGGAAFLAGPLSPAVGTTLFTARSLKKNYEQADRFAADDARFSYSVIEDKSDLAAIAEGMEKGVKNSVELNRWRAAGSAALGFGIGAGASYAAGLVEAGEAAPIDNGEATPEPYVDNEPSPGDYYTPAESDPGVEVDETPAEAPADDADVDETPEAEYTPEELAVGVGHGDGFTNLLHREFGLDGRESYLLYLYLVENIGGENIIEGIGTYTENGEFRISSPGDAEWTTEARELIDEWIKGRAQA